MVATPLDVFAAENVPQPLGAQLHVTPALWTSFVTVAVRLALLDVAIANVAGDTETMIGRIVIVTLADFVGSPDEVAVSITVPLLGTEFGAV